MEDEKKRPKNKLWRRILAVILIIALVASPIVMLKTQIRFSRLNYVEETASYAAQITEDRTEYLSENRLNRAWKYLQTLVKKPETYHDYELYASIAIAREDFEAAAEYLEGCLQTADGEAAADPAVLNLRLASLFILEEKPDLAAGYLDKAIELDPGLTSAYFLRGQLRAESGDTEGAAADLKSYVLQPDADPAIAASLAPLFEEAGDIPTAMACYTAGIGASETPDAALYKGRAKCFIRQEDLASARQDLERYFALTDADPSGEASAMLAMCLMDSGEYEDAAAYFGKAVENGYADTKLLYGQSMMCNYAAEKYEEAIADGKKVIAAGEEDESDVNEAQFWTGMSYMALGEYRNAETYLLKAEEGSPDREDIHYYLGVCAMVNGKQEAAAKEFTTSVEKDESRDASLYNRAICYVQLGRYDEALEDLEKAADSTVDPEVAADAADLLKELKKAIEEAEQQAAQEAAEDAIAQETEAG